MLFRISDANFSTTDVYAFLCHVDCPLQPEPCDVRAFPAPRGTLEGLEVRGVGRGGALGPQQPRGRVGPPQRLPDGGDEGADHHHRVEVRPSDRHLRPRGRSAPPSMHLMFSTQINGTQFDDFE